MCTIFALVFISLPYSKTVVVNVIQPYDDYGTTEKIALRILWREKIRIGDQETIILEVNPADNYLSLSEGGDIDNNNTKYDIYDDFNVVLESRLDLPGINISPVGLIENPYLRGQIIKNEWKVKSNLTGRTRGTLWLYIDLVPKNDGATQRMMVLALPLTIHSVGFWHLSTPIIRAILLTVLVLMLLLSESSLLIKNN